MHDPHVIFDLDYDSQRNAITFVTCMQEQTTFDWFLCYIVWTFSGDQTSIEQFSFFSVVYKTVTTLYGDVCNNVPRVFPKSEDNLLKFVILFSCVFILSYHYLRCSDKDLRWIRGIQCNNFLQGYIIQEHAGYKLFICVLHGCNLFWLTNDPIIILVIRRVLYCSCSCSCLSASKNYWSRSR